MTFLDRSWTWAEWNERVRRLAGALAELGVGRGDVVAFLDKNHPACVELTLAAASLGAANAIINFRLAGDELDYVINDSGAKVLIVGTELKPVVDTIRNKLTNVQRVIEVTTDGADGDEYEALLAAATPTGRAADVQPDDVCIVMYSSGTTGRPKGVALSQANVVAHTINGFDGLGHRRRRQELGRDAAVPRRRLVLRPVGDTHRHAQRDDAGRRRCLAGRRDPAGRQPHLPGAGGAGQGAGVRRRRGQSCSAASRPTRTAPPRCRCRCCTPR